jgi:hypothetical protein
MTTHDTDLKKEWETFVKSNPTVSRQDTYMYGAFAVYKMLCTAEDSTNKLRDVMHRLGEQFRNYYSVK